MSHTLTNVLTVLTARSALAKAGFKVAHIDRNAFYGANSASLAFDELIAWQDSSPNGFSSFSRSSSSLPNSRAYSFSLAPSIIPSIGPLISSLVSSGVSRYGGFRLVERIAIHDPASDSPRNVPGTRADIFNDSAIPLRDKTRIMRFLRYAAAGEFDTTKELAPPGAREMPFPLFLKDTFALPDEMTSAVAYALAYCTSAQGESHHPKVAPR